MARERGTFNFSASLEVKKQGALDSRLVIQTYAELLLAATWADTDNKVWLYDGMIVSVVNDTTGKNGIYMLTNKDSYNEEASWKRVDAEAAEKTTVEDILTSTSTTNALSANQGRVLKGMIDSNSEGIATVTSDLSDFIDTKGKANGLASLDENGKIPASQLNGELGRVVGIEKFVATKTDLDSLSPTPEDGDKYYVKDGDKIYTYSGSSFDEGAEPHENTIYNHRLADEEGRTNVLYRWDGSTMVEISASIALGETDGTAYEGSKGKQLRSDFDLHKSNENNPHKVTAAQLNIDSSLVGKTAAQLPISTATQTALDGKVDKVTGKSLVSDSEITKLAGLSDQTTLNSAIADAKKAGTDADTARKAVTGQSTSAYVANEDANYIAEATSMNDADLKLDAQVKINADAIAALSGSGAGSVDDKISAAIDDLKGTATEGYDTLGEIETAIKKEVSDRTAADTALKSELNTAIRAVDDKADANSTAISTLDTAVSAFKNKTVSTTIASPGVDTALPTTKAVVDYISKSTQGLANNMTYTVKSGDSTKMELKLIAVDGSTLSTIELDKENFISQFVKREATDNDHTADSSIAVGDPILVVTTVNGVVFRVNLKSLVDVYTGQATNSITTTVEGYTIKSDLKLDSTTQSSSPVKLTIGSNGLSADLSINSTKNGANGITLSKDGSGLAAELKIDTATNTTNGVAMSVGANGLSLGIVWTEL